MSSLFSLKVVLLGDSGVGKTSIVTRYTTGVVSTSVKPTVGAAFVTKEINVDNKEFELLIWDTAGQEVYRGLAPIYYRSSGIAIIVFDVTRPETYKSVSYWISELKLNVDIKPIIVVCANKVDKEGPKFPDEEVAQKYASENGAIYIETSALSGLGIDRMFQTSVSKYLKEYPNNNDINDNTQDINTNKKEENKKTCC